ncbi:MAG TPA: hypothetical protein VFX35_00340 [Solirubrobacterales bacterium]|nr:hypothetical protein [Solirubrobacterales bacterium]
MSAEEKDPKQSLREIRKRLIEGTRIKVRYGRATLTVRRSVVILGAPLGEALKEHRREAISTEDVAWRFLHEQTISHSPTFDWEAVKLNKLLPRVTAVVREPDLNAQTPEELIAELERIQADELAAKKRLSEQIQKYAAPLSASYLKGFRAADLGLVTNQKQMKQIREMVEPLRQQQPIKVRAKSQNHPTRSPKWSVRQRGSCGGQSGKAAKPVRPIAICARHLSSWDSRRSLSASAPGWIRTSDRRIRSSAGRCPRGRFWPGRANYVQGVRLSSLELGTNFGTKFFPAGKRLIGKTESD